MIRYIVRRRYGRTIEKPWDLVKVDDSGDPALEQLHTVERADGVRESQRWP